MPQAACLLQVHQPVMYSQHDSTVLNQRATLLSGRPVHGAALLSSVKMRPNEWRTPCMQWGLSEQGHVLVLAWSPAAQQLLCLLLLHASAGANAHLLQVSLVIQMLSIKVICRISCGLSSQMMSSAISWDRILLIMSNNNACQHVPRLHVSKSRMQDSKTLCKMRKIANSPAYFALLLKASQ